MSCDEGAFERDFGGMITGRAGAILTPSDAGDVVSAIAAARASKVPLSARGQGHTTAGQTITREGVVLSTEKLDAIVVEAGASPRAVVGAGARWDAVVAATIAAGYTPPTLTDFLGLSVGGTLSVGGVGGQSFRYGLQTDNVASMRVVTGAGAIVDCAADRDAELFNAVRAGLGQCAIIVEATLRLIRAPEEVAVFKLPYANLGDFLRDQVKLTRDGRFDYLLGSILPREDDSWGFSLEAVGPADSGPALLGGLRCDLDRIERSNKSYRDYVSRLDVLPSLMKSAGTWSSFHPWMDLFVGASSAEAIIAKALSLIRPRELIDGWVMTYPLVRDRCTTPLAGIPREPEGFLFDVLPNFPRRDPEALDDFTRRCGEIWRYAKQLGAGVYPIGFPVGTAALARSDWERQTGADWAPFVGAKRRYDPDDILTPGPRMFSE